MPSSPAVSAIGTMPAPEKIHGQQIYRLPIGFDQENSQSRDYDILIGHLLPIAGQLIAPFAPLKRVTIITDETVAALHLEQLLRSLTDAGLQHRTITLPPGEASKSFTTLSQTMDQLLALGLERKDIIVAFGGGVIGDLAGFIAAIALRGIDFIQIPTTLLAQVDSSIGGKTAIDVPAGKNLVGAFHQPRLVLADSYVLATLAPRQFLAGYAEVVKYGAIDDPAFFQWLESHAADIIDGDLDLRQAMVLHACRSKARVVMADEKEKGQRALLNLGHTFGHALEKFCGFDDILLHGEAVAIGMVMAFDYSVALGLCPVEAAARLSHHLAAVGLPTSPCHIDGIQWDGAAILDAMAGDKKTENGKITLILAHGIGQSFITQDIDLPLLRLTIEEAIRP